ncbi:MAG: nucleotidyltransferase domain-containing protein [Bacteroidota bacterium]
MNEAGRWRVELARKIAGYYASHPGIVMIVIGGSAARGVADAYSDIDMLIYWTKVDGDWLASAPLEPHGGKRFTFRGMFDDRVYLEQYRIGDLKIDVGHLEMAWWEEQVADVLEKHDEASDVQEMLYGFLNAIPLHGDQLYAESCDRISRYPEALALKMVTAHLHFYPLWVFSEHGLGRGDLLSFYDYLRGAITDIIGVLAGLNRIYTSTNKPKRTGDLLRKMPIAPRDVAGRIDAILAGDRRDAVPLLGELIEEVIDLVEVHMPEVDTARARTLFAFQVWPCRTMPEFPVDIPEHP